jgi:hypothetical protein
MKKLLLQTTIPYTADDWNSSRFGLLAEYLDGIRGENGERMFQVQARDRENLSNGDDRVLSKIDESDVDEIWLFGVDVGNGLTESDCAAVGRFRKRGGGVLTTRDHQDLGISFCTLGGVGAAHHFHSKNTEDDPARLIEDDTESPNISWPNYHSGSNGDYQQVRVASPVHPVMRNEKNASGRIERLPAHPHEGAISPPGGEQSRVIAIGKSQFTGREFNVAIAFEANGGGRAIADSSFHHFCDYNLDPARGCPSFVTEPPGRGMLESAEALEDARAYFRNLATWLS